MRSSLPAGVFLLITVISVAQQPAFRNFGLDEGLPSTEVYKIRQDRDGYLWMATDRGIVKYNGESFRVFSTADGLTDNTVFDLYEDPFGVMWFITRTGGICYYDGNRIVPHPRNDSLLTLLAEPHFPDRMIMDSTHTIWIVPDFTMSGMIRLTEKEISWVRFNDNKEGYRDIVMQVGNGKYINGLLPGSVPSAQVVISKQDDLYRVKRTFRRSSYAVEVARTKQGTWILCNESLCIHYSDTGLLQKINIPAIILGVFVDNKDNLWICSTRGIYLYRKEETHYVLHGHYLPEEQVSDIFQDREGGYWISSVTSGVYYMPSPHIMTWNSSKGITRDLGFVQVLGETVVTGSEAGVFYLMKKKGNTIIPVDSAFAKFNNLKSMLLDTHQVILNSGSYELPSGKSIGKRKPWLIGPGKLSVVNDIEKGRNRHLLIASSGFQEVMDEEIIFDSRQHGFDRTCTAVYGDPSGAVWVGTLKGLYQWKAGKAVMHQELPALKARITDIDGSADGKVWILTRGSGAVLWDGRSYTSISTRNGLSSDFCTRVLVESDSVAWIGTNRGLNKIVLDRNKPGSFRIARLGRIDGLPSNQVSDIARSGNLLLLATGNWLCVFDPDTVLTTGVAPLINIISFEAGNRKWAFTEIPNKLEAGERDISVNFEGLYFKRDGKIRYRYKLVGYDSTWQHTENTSVHYTNLTPAHYSFRVQASYGQGPWSDEAVIKDVQIGKYFFEQWWFRMLVVMAILALALLLFNLFLRQYKNRERNKRKLLEAEHLALRSQMNPHFFFNALNSIQYFIATKDIDLSNHYLSRFSRLVRKVLENSKRSRVSFHEEIDTIRHYLDLECMRFPGKVTYTITIDPSLDLFSIMVPPMLIQPLIENAIWHGLTPRKEGGLLEINIHASGSMLVIEIKDNGIGRKRSLEVKRGDIHHKSSGIGNIEERIELLFGKGQDTGLFFTDHYSDEGATGTTARLQIPIEMSI